MNEKVNGFLQKMGLTEYEARTLATLFHAPEAHTPEVAAHAQVPKTRVYDVLDSLVDRGLALRVFSHPKKYRALPLNDVFQKLISDQKEKVSQWEKEASALVQEMSASASPSPTERVLKVKNKTDFYKILAHEMATATKSIHGLTQLDVHHPALHDALANAAQRNVKVQLTGEHPSSFLEASQKWGKNVELQSSKPGMHAYVLDGEKVVMMLSDMRTEKPEYHFAIWPENKGLAKSLTQTFDAHWK